MNNQNPYYYPVHPPVPMYRYPYPIRPLPPVNPIMFVESAKKMRPLLMDAEILMEQISKSTSFSQKIMVAAQQSKTGEVEKMIYGTGIQSKPKIKYNPTGLIIHFSNNADESDCCHLEIRMRWGM